MNTTRTKPSKTELIFWRILGGSIVVAAVAVALPIVGYLYKLAEWLFLLGYRF